MYRNIYIYIYIYICSPLLALCKVEDDQQLQYKNRRQLGWIGGQLMQSASGITTTLVPSIKVTRVYAPLSLIWKVVGGRVISILYKQGCRTDAWCIVHE